MTIGSLGRGALSGVRVQSTDTENRGCTTPRVIANIDEVVEEGSAKSEKDFTVIDGYEELSPENQEKVREALEQGHVADEDWKGVRVFHVNHVLRRSVSVN